ncbi:serine/threonine protein kinase [Hydrocoleum sp. CS-953]|nr:ATP-binding sensor histidine kinase [Hydrocoleum sp. CS-953]OZH51237.1 serine/threonine protein kinase [Hydrocoleum sp. CS-953]
MLNLPGYQETKQIYTGTRTLVYRAIRATPRQLVIVKVLRNSHPNFNELVTFRNQYIITSHLKHLAIVQPLALERYSNGYALIMEDSGAIALSEYWPNSEQTLSSFLHIAIQLAEALHYLSGQRIIHKDIKPSNILIHRKTKQVQLIDFSISTLLPTEQQQQLNPNVLEGTLAYISPEQTGRMNRGIDYRTDFYSLGVTFFELLTGKLPFDVDDPMELIHCHIAQKGEFPKEAQVPEVVQSIVLKLMAKNAEDRYQSALGLKHDLEKCLQQLETTGKTRSFELGTRDVCDRFLIPEKLYGRETEVQKLLDAFVRLASPQEKRVSNPPLPPLKRGRREEKKGEGRAEMILVAGFSGIGKTAVINEVHKPIVRQRGYFIKGKFDQFNRNIPFSAFVQAFRDLMGQLLSESDAELTKWKIKILEAVGENGQVLIEVIPELEKIIGKQPPVPELSGSAAQNRFNLLFGKFMRVFTTKDHPLVIFLDDLQWADSASLNLLKLLMNESDSGYLLVLGAYRDNEVFPAHPLMLALDEIDKQGANIKTLTLAALEPVDITRLVADTLLCTIEIATPLSKLVYQKTKGNPFFTTQFLKGLHEDGWIKFDQEVGYWQCDLTQIRQLALTDDVVEFMVGRLQKLSAETQNVLKLAACIGNQFDLGTLVVVCEESQQEVATNLWAALQEGLIIPQSETYKFFQGEQFKEQSVDDIAVGYRFLHDRVQQAAYSLILEEEKQTTHYHIGQLLFKTTPKNKLDENIFAIVNHFNLGREKIDSVQEQEQLIYLNLVAGRRARISSAYEAATYYCQTGLQLLSANAWEQNFAIVLEIHLEGANSASLMGEFQTVDRLVATIIHNTTDILEQAKAIAIQIQSLIGRSNLTEAIKVARTLLESLDVELPEPDSAIMESALANIKSQLAKIDDVANLEPMSDPKKLTAINILSTIASGAYIGAPELYPLIVLKQIELSLQFGYAAETGYAFSTYGLILCLNGEIESGNHAGSIALRLMELSKSNEYKAKIFNLVYPFVRIWQEHLQNALNPLLEGYQAGLESGDLEFASYCIFNHCLLAYFSGENLLELRQKLDDYGVALAHLKQSIALNFHQIEQQAVCNWLGESDDLTMLIGNVYNETERLPQHQTDGDICSIGSVYTQKVILNYHFAAPNIALETAKLAESKIAGVAGTAMLGAFYFYHALILLANSIPIAEDLEKLKQWAKLAPSNYLHKLNLVEAENCRLLNKPYEAMELYDSAIEIAQKNEYIQEEALANELAAKFYLDRGKKKTAAFYMQEAYYCYARWGAKAKTDKLEQTYPQLLIPILQPQQQELNSLENLESLTEKLTSITHSKTTKTGVSETLDLASILQTTQALSSTIELNQLLADIVEIILINAGAEKTALLIRENDEWQIRATAEVATDGTVETSTTSLVLTTEIPVPIRLIQYVKHTQETVLINEGQTEITGIIEGYLLERQPQSVLCLPLLHQGNLVAILYLEHSTTKGVFTSYRQTIVQFLCTQATISLQNALLYRQATQALQDLQQAQLQIIQSEKMSALGNLMAGVAHEINNPTGFLEGNIQPAQEYVQDLLGLIDLYQSEYPQPTEVIAEEIEAIELEFIREDLPKLLGSMNVGVERIRNISSSLRTFARKDQEHKTNFNIHEGIDSSLLILKHRTKANEKRPEIEILRKYEQIPLVECFPGQLNQVFMNILANAIDAFEEANVGKTLAEIKENPNRITLYTSVIDENQVQIEIEDNGSGIKPETKERIFEHGFTTKGVGKGTGLGMAIAHQIITEKHGGKIICDSTVGEGTIFTITLPRA